jgi:hypothetical protein
MLIFRPTTFAIAVLLLNTGCEPKPPDNPGTTQSGGIATLSCSELKKAIDRYDKISTDALNASKSSSTTSGKSGQNSVAMKASGYAQAYQNEYSRRCS